MAAFRKSVLFGYLAALLLWFLSGCQRQKDSVAGLGEDFVKLQAADVPAVRVLCWPEDKPAAYTIEFDDARTSHYLLAGPELRQRRLRGTFNLNTAIEDWTPWIALAKDGNEIASHTVHHVKLTQIPLAEAEQELVNSQRDIQRHIGKKPVSFTAPYGLYNAAVDSLVLRYYLSGRDHWGLNPSTLPDSNFAHLRAVGVYPPLTPGNLRKLLLRAIRERSYLIIYFHSLTGSTPPPDNPTFEPFSFFQQHLDDVQSLADSLWIAPRGEVVKYMRLREHARVRFSVEGGLLSFWLETELDPQTFDVPLQIAWQVPAAWRHHPVWIRPSRSGRWRLLRDRERRILSIRAGEKISLVGVRE